MVATEVHYNEEDEEELPDVPPEDENYIWQPEPEPIEDPIVVEGSLSKIKELSSKLPKIKPSQFTQFAFLMPTEVGEGDQQTIELRNFSFKARPHLKRIYDTASRRVLLLCARQTEKCGSLISTLYLDNGEVVKARDIKVGQRVLSLNMSGAANQMTSGRVSWISKILKKPGIIIKTRQGHELEVATTHPIRIWGDWKEAGKVVVGDRVAAIRRAGRFGCKEVSDERVELLGFMVANGNTTQPGFTFSGGRPVSTSRFLSVFESIGGTYKQSDLSREDYRLHRTSGHLLYDWLKEDGLVGKYSHEKELPGWVFELSQKQTSLLLNRLWSCDGSCRRTAASQYNFEYCTSSKILSRQVQSLLWKFGIPSAIRENYPSYITTSGEPARVSYILRIETQSGIRIFLTSIGALGKSEEIDLPDVEENNNRDTFPIEINELIVSIMESRRRVLGRSRCFPSLRSVGLRETLEYPPTRNRLQRYIDFFESNHGFDQRLVALLRDQMCTDLYWDAVESIEDLGEIECVDLEVDHHHNFVIDGVVTHNSTSLGNLALAYSCLVPGFRTLYVSPSATQTKTFSSDRIKEPLETSEVLRQFTTRMLSQNIFEKQFVNRSKITLRYAFLNADRCRGIAAWALFLDELQDIINDNIPVIEACQNHAPQRWRRNVYSGTPKSLDNTIETYWSSMSTMGEWVVPCEGCNTWNILGESNIGKKGIICSKCGKYLYAQHPRAQWAAQRDFDEVKVPFEGYRISQLMVPWVDWKEVLISYERSSRDKFYNEVLGISFDSGIRPLTRAQVRACCRDDISMQDLKKYKLLSHSQPVFAGLDWGSSEHSFTVLTLATYIERKFRVFYMNRYVGEYAEPERQMTAIIETLKYFNVRLIGADYGGGFYPNDRLTREFGPNKVWKYQYASNPKRAYKWNPELKRYILHRSEVMSQIFNAIKRKRDCEFPRWAEFEKPYAQDFLNIYSETNEQIRLIQYRHAIDKPDDSFHSFLYAWLVSMLIIQRPDIIRPNREDAKGQQIPVWNGDLWQG